MPTRECEKCDRALVVGQGLCTACGWENDLGYFVNVSKDKAPEPTPDEASHQLEVEKFASIGPTCLVLAFVLLVVEIGLAILVPGWRLLLILSPLAIAIQTPLAALTVWACDYSRSNRVFAEGGAATYWGKCLAATLASYLIYALFGHPALLLIRSFGFPVFDLSLWILLVPIHVLLLSLGWFTAVRHYFEFSVERGLAAVFFMGCMQLSLGYSVFAIFKAIY